MVRALHVCLMRCFPRLAPPLSSVLSLPPSQQPDPTDHAPPFLSGSPPCSEHHARCFLNTSPTPPTLLICVAASPRRHASALAAPGSRGAAMASEQGAGSCGRLPSEVADFDASTGPEKLVDPRPLRRAQRVPLPLHLHQHRAPSHRGPEPAWRCALCLCGRRRLGGGALGAAVPRLPAHPAFGSRVGLHPSAASHVATACEHQFALL